MSKQKDFEAMCNKVRADIVALNEVQNLENLRAYLTDSECLSNMSEDMFNGSTWRPSGLPVLSKDAQDYLELHIWDVI